MPASRPCSSLTLSLSLASVKSFPTIHRKSEPSTGQSPSARAAEEMKSHSAKLFCSLARLSLPISTSPCPATMRPGLGVAIRRARAVRAFKTFVHAVRPARNSPRIHGVVLCDTFVHTMRPTSNNPRMHGMGKHHTSTTKHLNVSNLCMAGPCPPANLTATLPSFFDTLRLVPDLLPRSAPLDVST